MAGSFFNAVFGRLFKNGTELPLRGGLNFQGFTVNPFNDSAGKPAGYTIIGTGGGGDDSGGGNTTSTYVTTGDETSLLPNARRIVAGSNISINTATAGQLIMSATAGASNGIKWVVADTAARQALTVVSGDVPSLAFQTDTNTLWVAAFAGTGSAPWLQVTVNNLPTPVNPGDPASKAWVESLGATTVFNRSMITGSLNVVATIPIDPDTTVTLQVDSTVRNQTTGIFSALHSAKITRLGSAAASIIQSLDPVQVDSGVGVGLLASEIDVNANTARVTFLPGAVANLLGQYRIYTVFTSTPPHA